MTTRPETHRFGLLGTLAPQMAQDLGEAFSVDRIGTRTPDAGPTEPAPRRRGAQRFAGRAAAFVLVAAAAVSITVSVLYLIQLP